MNKTVLLAFIIFIISFINNFLLTYDVFIQIISDLNMNLYLNILSGNSIFEYIRLILNKIVYFLLFFNINDLNSINGVL